jgi:predicted glycosyltransferase
MARTLRIVAYAVNGSGVGHLTRLVGVGRWLRRYAAHAGVRAELWFLTSSEADGLLFSEGMASFKLPSKTAVGEAGVDKLAYLALAKQWVWHSLGLLRPSLLLVDTFPRGSFGELLSSLDLAEHRAFIYRPLKASLAGRADFQAMLPLYDLILVPEEEGAAGVLVPDGIRDRVRHLGPMGVRERVELLDRGEARRRLAIPDEKLAIYVSAGGGGDPGAERQLLSVIDALDDGSLHLVVGAGPLYRGLRRHGPGITWLAGETAAELMGGFDGAVAAAGYNSFFELMHAGVPTVFLPQPKVADEQARRAERAVAVGAARILSSLGDRAGLLEATELWRDPGTRAQAAQAARELVPENGARRAAAALLRLLLPAAEVDAAEEAVSDELLRASAELGLELDAFFGLIHALDPRGSGDGAAGEPEAVSGSAIALLRHAEEVGIPLPAALRLAGLVSRKLLFATPLERARAVRELLDGLLPFDDWAGAYSLLKVFGAEKQLPAPRFLEELLGFLSELRRGGEDLYRGIARLSAAQGTGAELASNEEMLRAARERPG